MGTWILQHNSICIIIGKDSKVKYIKYMDKNNPPSQADIDYVVKLVGDLIK
jgi:predicted transcriptional regulator